MPEHQCKGPVRGWKTGVGGGGKRGYSEHKSLCSIELVGKKLTEM